MAFEQSSWGRLWDQTESVAAHTKEGIDFFEKYGKFCYDRALIEEQYSKSLRELAKKNFGKRAPNDDSKHSFSYMSSFYTMLRELESLAGQHEVVAETLKKSIHPQINNKCAELRQTRKNHLNYLSKLNMDLAKSVEAMEKTHRNYAKAFKEAEAAHIKHEQNDKNLELSRAAVEKSKNNVIQKNQLCEEAKKNYANALLIANDAKTKHFQVELPNVLEQMKSAEIDRINHTRLAMQKTIEAETNIMRIIQACYDEMQKAVSSINPDSDTQVVIEQNVTGYAMPDQYPFDDLGDPGQIVHGDNTSENSSTSKRGTLPLNTSKSSSKNGSLKSASIGRRQSMHQKFFGGSSNSSEKPKVNGVLSDYGNLPPQQRCRKIQQKLEELAKEQETLLKSLEGVEKMAEVYRSNPKLGSLKDVEPKVTEYKAQLQRVTADIARFKILLETIQNEMRAGGSIYGSEGGSSDGTTISMREGDMLSLEKEKACIEHHHHQNGGGSSTTGYGSPRSSNGYETYDTSDSSSVNKGGTPQPLGTCIALYGFEGSSDGTTVSMKEGDRVFLLEKDVGDGWTRIRHKVTQIEGFVPTSYLHCQ